MGLKTGRSTVGRHARSANMLGQEQKRAEAEAKEQAEKEVGRAELVANHGGAGFP